MNGIDQLPEIFDLRMLEQAQLGTGVLRQRVLGIELRERIDLLGIEQRSSLRRLTGLVKNAAYRRRIGRAIAGRLLLLGIEIFGVLQQ